MTPLTWSGFLKRRDASVFQCLTVTCNHIHLLVKDTSPNVIADSMQLIAGRTGQQYNQRKRRHGAFWEDRYHATAIEADEHLQRCLVYIDLNMVRAGAVSHPSEWPHSGYREIQNPPKRYGIIDLRQLTALCGFSELADFQRAHRDSVEEALKRERVAREGRWSEAVAVGSLSFVNTVKSELGYKAAHREVIEQGETYVLREEGEAYSSNFASEKEVLSSENARFWNENPEATVT
ncbi:MAG: transposase [Candidatus Binatia bacterium]